MAHLSGGCGSLSGGHLGEWFFLLGTFLAGFAPVLVYC